MQRKILGIMMALPLLPVIGVSQSWASSGGPQISNSGVFLSAVADARLARNLPQLAPPALGARQKQDRCYRFGVCDD